MRLLCCNVFILTKHKLLLSKRSGANDLLYENGIVEAFHSEFDNRRRLYVASTYLYVLGQKW